MLKVLEVLNNALIMKDHDIEYWKNKAQQLENDIEQLIRKLEKENNKDGNI